MKSTLKLSLVCAAGILAAGSLHAYDGTNCKTPGDCWEAKPGYPEKIAGSKYDPKHSKTELEKQIQALSDMEKRNAEKAAQFKKTGKWPTDS